jgi:hypothetical protein
VYDSRHDVRISGLPSLKVENNMSVKVLRGAMKGTTHVGESATG